MSFKNRFHFSSCCFSFDTSSKQTNEHFPRTHIHLVHLSLCLNMLYSETQYKSFPVNHILISRHNQQRTVEFKPSSSHQLQNLLSLHQVEEDFIDRPQKQQWATFIHIFSPIILIIIFLTNFILTITIIIIVITIYIYIYTTLTLMLTFLSLSTYSSSSTSLSSSPLSLKQRY